VDLSHPNDKRQKRGLDEAQATLLVGWFMKISSNKVDTNTLNAASY
jgi:hypothetical protein